MGRKMKDSGILWIGLIPEDWEARKAKHYYKMQIGFTPDTKREKYYDENGHDWVNISDLSNNREISKTKNKISSSFIKEFSPKKIPKGSLLYSFKLSVGQVAFAGKDIYSNEAIVSFLKDNSCNLNFLYYSSYMIVENANENIYGAKILNQNLINNALIIFPPLPEQQKIAAYLDSKVSQIDSIIGKQTQLIQEYKAYKQSIITETVTKGLNPDIPMKDSGIEWIGEIPEHWEVKKIKQYVSIADGTHATPKYVTPETDTYPLVTSKCINNGVIDLGLANHISEFDYLEINKRSEVNQYDVIMPMIGTVGNPAIVTVDANFAIKNVALFKTNKCYIVGKYLTYVLNSDIIQIQFKTINKGGVQDFISQRNIKDLKFVLPYNVKQIVEFLDQKCKYIDDLMTEKQKLIEELETYKKSLIYECVTGKKEIPDTY